MSIFSKLFFTLLSSSVLAWLRDFVSRVTGDGGTLSDQGHTKEVYADTNDYNPTLIQSCDSGKATVAYSLFAFSDVENFELRVISDLATNTSKRQNALFAQHLWRNELHNNASLVVPCTSFDAGTLYAYQPTVAFDVTLLDGTWNKPGELWDVTTIVWNL